MKKSSVNGILYLESKAFKVRGKMLKGSCLRDSEGIPFPLLRTEISLLLEIHFSGSPSPSVRMWLSVLRGLFAQTEVYHVETVKEMLIIVDWLIVWCINSHDNQLLWNCEARDTAVDTMRNEMWNKWSLPQRFNHVVGEPPVGRGRDFRQSSCRK